MSDEKLSDVFKEVGDNLVGVLKAAWDRPEREEIQRDIGDGLNAVGDAINKAVGDFSTSDLGENIKTEVSKIKERVESADVETRIRSEIHAALRTVNAELDKLAHKIRSEDEA